MAHEEPPFDIFSGTMDRYAIWLETVRGLANARDRMLQIAAERSGRYFLFSSQSHTVLAQVDTTSFARPGSAEKKEAG